MLSYSIRRSLAPLFAVALVAAACGGGNDAATDEAARAIELAPRDSMSPMNDAPAATPDTKATTPAPAPAPAKMAATPAPRPAAAAPAAATPSRASSGVIASGTAFAVSNGMKICTNTHKTGDEFTTTLGADVMGSNGARIPAGATVTLKVTESAISKNSKDNWKLAFDVVSVTVNGETMPVTGDVTKVETIEAVRSQSTGQQVGKVATGAAVGAVAGKLLGKSGKATVVGAAVGAAAGGAVAAGTADYEGCLAEKGAITVTLTAPLTIRM